MMNKKRLLALVLAVVLVVGMIPTVVFAYEMSPYSWDSGKYVYWDVAEQINNSFPTHSKYTGTATRVKSVYFNGDKTNGKVAKGNSSKTTSPWSISGENAKTLSAYYPDTTMFTANNDTSVLTIVPGDGYYVRQVIVACTAKQVSTVTVLSDAYNCDTWQSGNEYNETLDYEKSGAVTIDIPSLAFCHLSNVIKNSYFILIDVAPLPSPLYVEYKCGTEVSSIDIFKTNKDWLDPASGNAGDYDITRENDRFTYTSSGTTDDEKAAMAANWKHYANTISPDAVAAAAAQGYVFDGWEAKYYSTCDSSFRFSGQIGTANYFAESEQVPLMNHVQLTAKWKKANVQTLKVNKVVENDTDPNAVFNFNVILGSKTETFSLKNGESKTFTAIQGTSYTVSETQDENYTTTVSGNESGTLNSNITVTYTNTRKVQNVTVKKVVDGETDATNFAFSAKLWSDSKKDRQIPFPETIGTGITRSSDGLTATFTLNNGDTVEFSTLPVGAVLEVIETDAKGADSTTNDTNPSNNGKTATYTITDTSGKVITFTNVYEINNSSVEVTKIVVDPYNAYPGAEFTFTATMQDGSLFANGEASVTFTLKHGESEQIDEIPIGKTLVIVEEEYNGFTTTNTHGTSGNAAVTVTADVQKVIYTNTAITRTLTITKAVVGEDNNNSYPVELRINNSLYEGPAERNGEGVDIIDGALSLEDGDNYVISGLPVNTTYSILEDLSNVTPPEGYEYKNPVYTVGTTASEQAPVNAELNGDTSVIITNELFGVYGHLLVSKTGIQSVDHHAYMDDFRREETQSTIYRIQGNGIDMQIVIVGNSSVLIKNLPVGEYTVTELEDWSWRYDAANNTQTSVVTAGQTAKAPFSNTRTKRYWLSGDSFCKNLWTSTGISQNFG